MPDSLTRSEQRTLRRYFEANRLFIAKQEEITGTIMATFLGVTLFGQEADGKEPLSLKELGEKIGLPNATVSRHLRYLGDRQRLGVPGMDMVRTEINPENRRQKFVRLTAKGRALRDSLLYVLRGEHKAA